MDPVDGCIMYGRSADVPSLAELRSAGGLAGQCKGWTHIALFEHVWFGALVSQYGRTALFYASNSGYLSIVSALLSFDAKVDLPDRVRAVFYLFQIPIPTCNICGMSRIQDGQTALMRACERCHATVVEVLLRYNAQVDLQDKVLCVCYIPTWFHVKDSGLAWQKGWTALMRASRGGDSSVVAMLLKRGARLDLRNEVIRHDYLRTRILILCLEYFVMFRLDTQRWW